MEEYSNLGIENFHYKTTLVIPVLRDTKEWSHKLEIFLVQFTDENDNDCIKTYFMSNGKKTAFSTIKSLHRNIYVYLKYILVIQKNATLRHNKVFFWGPINKCWSGHVTKYKNINLAAIRKTKHPVASN